MQNQWRQFVTAPAKAPAVPAGNSVAEFRQNNRPIGTFRHNIVYLLLDLPARGGPQGSGLLHCFPIVGKSFGRNEKKGWRARFHWTPGTAPAELEAALVIISRVSRLFLTRARSWVSLRASVMVLRTLGFSFHPAGALVGTVRMVHFVTTHPERGIRS